MALLLEILVAVKAPFHVSTPENRAQTSLDARVECSRPYRGRRRATYHANIDRSCPPAYQTWPQLPLPRCGLKPTVSRPQVYNSGAMIDTTAQPLYTRVDVPLRTGAERGGSHESSTP
jgi:hypothetical protein